MENSSAISPLFPVLADQLLSEGKTSEAVALCEKGVVAFPRYSTGYLIAAKVYLHAKRYDDAIAMCEKGLAYTPSSKALLKMQEMIRTDEKKNVEHHSGKQNEAAGEIEKIDDNAPVEETLLEKLAHALEGAK